VDKVSGRVRKLRRRAAIPEIRKGGRRTARTTLCLFEPKRGGVTVGRRWGEPSDNERSEGNQAGGRRGELAVGRVNQAESVQAEATGAGHGAVVELTEHQQDRSRRRFRRMVGQAP
jgi:hypothetical protein